jgi:transketolase
MAKDPLSRQETLAELRTHFPHWEMLKDMTDQCLDLMLNLRQSGHPGGSRSKAHILLATLLSGVMRSDLRQPEKRFGDRFILVAGHTIPLLYAVLAVLNEALLRAGRQGGGKRFRFAAPERVLTFEDLLTLRHRGGLPGHAEMAGKTLILKANTGPSGHGSPVAAGQALALKLAGLEEVRVFALEGEGGTTAGVTHETQNSAWGLGLDNLYYLVDWNDFGIDNHRISAIVYGTPADWFSSHGWRTFGTEEGMGWTGVTETLLAMTTGDNPEQQPTLGWFKTRKGREYGIYDNASHGTPHKPMNSPRFWEMRKSFCETYGIELAGFGEPAPETEEARVKQTRENLKRVLSLYDSHPELLSYTAQRLAEIGDRVPEEGGKRVYDFSKNPSADPVLTNYRGYPRELFLAPGERAANRAGLDKFGAWVNALCREKYGRPLFIAMSADLADSTNISGFAKDFGDRPGCGVYERSKNPRGALLPQGITEFANAGISAGLAAVNLAPDPLAEYNGFYAACSTYGSFVYLKYGPFRLFSQAAQDSELKTGKILWVAGHSGPETAEDSRTHFGIFAPGVTQMFPEGRVINLYPWEHNEVAPMIGAALATEVPIIALHLTRPPIEIPDRQRLGLASHFEAARGAYLLRDYRAGQPKMGTVFVQGTVTTANVVGLLPRLEEAGLNVKLVAAVSWELFRLQPASYRESIVGAADWPDSTVITNGSRRNMHDWMFSRRAEEYAMSSDWDNRWRTGGSVAELAEEARLSPQALFEGIERFARERGKRLAGLRRLLD